jgi:formylglycine-generating enzyme required for sulfatase activity
MKRISILCVAPLTLALFGAFVGCSASTAPALAQWSVLITTDAPVPQLGDRLLIEVFNHDGTAYPAGRREIGVSHVEDWPVSFGVVPAADGRSPFVRARLYRADHTGKDGLPEGALVLDSLAELAPTTGVSRVELRLSMACFGVASRFEDKTSCDPSTGKIAPVRALATANDAAFPAPDSWPPATSVACPTAAPAGMVCVPGALYAMGSNQGFPSSSDTASIPEHLVRISPFYLDAVELTVGDVRKLVNDQGLPPPTKLAVDATHDACTYAGPSASANDAMPINCISWATAKKACELLGKRLPTEAEWELAAGRGAAESTYPWGEDTHVCDYAVVGRGRETLDIWGFENASCRAKNNLPWGPVAGGSDKDVTPSGIKNLGGNVSEWVEDFVTPYGTGCWTVDGAYLQDPVCDAAGAPPVRGIRGGSWASMQLFARGFERNGSDGGWSPFTGVRCAKD